MPKNNETTTKFNADISGLKSAMQDAKKAIAVANSEFKAASSAMDNWSKSTDGISAKLKQLDTTMNSQKTILSSLEKQYALVSQEQGKDSKAAQDLLISINNQKAAINNTQKQIDKWTTSLNELQAESNQTETATQTLTNTINKQESELSQLKAQYKDVVLAQGENSTEAKQLATQISNLSGELSSNKTKLKDASSAADALDKSLDNASDSADEAEGGFTVLKGTIANLAAQAITKAVDALKDFITQANNVDQAINGLQTKTGATTEEMKKYESVMKNIYNSNYGESYEDVAEAMGQVIQTMGDLNDTDLQNITTNGIALRDTFGFEMPESMRAVNSLMKQFGITADEAYNLIAQGAQNGLNQNDDLLDTINEYSVQFSNAGYSANDMFNMLKNGADSGTWSVDKLGDAVKEMNIRFSDGTVAEALTNNSKALGLTKKDVQSLQDEYNKGGTSAQNAVGKMIDSILSVKDETQQYQLGVSVFGTMWEDLGATTIKSLMSTKGELSSTKKAMDDIKNTKYDDAGNSVQQLGRMFKDQILTPIQNNINPVINDFVQKIITNFPQIVQAAKDFVNTIKEWIPTLQIIGASIAAYLVATKIIAFVNAIKTGTLAIQLMSAAQTVLNTVMSLNPIGLIVAAIAGLVAAFVILWNKSDAFRNFWIGLWDGIVSATSTIVSSIGTFFTQTIPNFFTGLINWVKTNWSTILVFLINPFAGLFKYFYENNTKFKEFVDTAVNFIKELPSKVWTWLLATINKVGTWLKNMVAKAKETGTNFVTNVVNFIKNLPSKVWSWLVNVVTKVMTWRNNMIAKAKDVATNFVNNVINFIKTLPSKLWTWLLNTIQKVVTWATDLGKKGKEAAESLIKSVVDGAKELPGKMLKIGKNIVNGVWKGITNAKDKFVKNVKKFFSGIVDGAKDALDIHSPSRVAEKQIGEQFAEGAIVGVKNKYKKAKKTSAELATLLYESAKEKVDTYKKYNTMSLEAEYAYWNKIVSATKKGSQGYKDAMLELKQVKKELDNSVYTVPKERLDAYKKYNKMSIQEEVNYWKKIYEATKKSEPAYKDILLEYKNIKAELNKQLKELEDDYAKKVSEVKTKLINDIQAITNKYDEAVKSRANSITSSMNLFDEFNSTTEKSANDLLANLESQVKGIQDYDAALKILASRGVSNDFMEQIQNMGISALANIQTLVSMTDEELTKYVELWNTKNSLATDRAVTEYAYLREECQEEIKKLIEESNKNLNELEKDYNNSLIEMGVKTKETSVNIGKSIVNGLKEGIASQREELMSYITNLFNSIVSTAKNSLDLTGAINGSNLGTTVVSKAAKLPQMATGGFVTRATRLIAGEAGTEAILPLDRNTGYMRVLAKQLARELGATSNVNGVTGSLGGVVNNYNQTINSPKALSRLEIYRQSRNLFNFAGGVTKC